MTNTTRLERTIHEAIDWAVRLQSQGAGKTPDPVQQADFERWLAQSPDHVNAWARLQTRLDIPAAVRGVDQRAIGQARQAREILTLPRRRGALKSLLGLGLGAGAAALLVREGVQWSRPMLADLRTGIGERLQRQLADGSALYLNAASAVDMVFDASQRSLTLHAGELLVQVAPDPGRPFVVRTAQGQVRALGTRFLVRCDPDAGRTWVSVQEHAVQVSANQTKDPAGNTSLRLDAGSQAWIDIDGVHRAGLASVSMDADAWLHGRLAVLDAPLSDVLDRLRPYRSGIIRIDPAVADLRVQGVFSLDDTDRTLRALAETQPLRIDYYSRWIVMVRPR
ncbi:MAG: FecR domain-containing protein [Corticimicrobacter sp.]|uniref:FecR family protein n=1 Tax=Corticimicrobacter sp. TaxID=2678536 RepID=UPI0032DA3BEE